MSLVHAKDCEEAKEVLAEVEGIFKQHIADEEGQVLRLLIETYGRDGAEEEIRVFRQHRPIYALLQRVQSLSRLPPEELSSRGDELRKLLEDHTLAEERRVFPRALSTGEGR